MKKSRLSGTYAAILVSGLLLGPILGLAIAQETNVRLPSIQQSEEDFGAHASFERSTTINDSQLSLIVDLELASRDAGILEEIRLKEGDSVDKGTIIAKLDREMFGAELRAAMQELAIAQQESENDVDLRYAKVSEEVNQKILDRSKRAIRAYAKSVSTTELEQLRLELERSRLSGEQAERQENVNNLTVKLKREQMAIAEIRLDNRAIKSPASGIITQIYKQPGEWVQSGEPIVRIISADRLRIICKCDLDDARPNEIGTRIKFFPRGSDGDRPLVGKISFVSPEIEPVNQDYEIWAEIDNVDGLLSPGMDGTIEIELKQE